MREKNNRSVYVLLMRSRTAFSRFVHTFTRAQYTHASIGLSENCTELYSFARRYTRLPLPAGFVKESVKDGIMKLTPDAPCALYEIKVTEETYNKIREEIEIMKMRNCPYSLSGPFLCWLNIEVNHPNKYFCSQFVADILCKSEAIKLRKPAALYKPLDFTEQEELQMKYLGTLGGLAKMVEEESESNDQSEEVVSKII